MNIKTFLFDDDRGVSPVIEVILMVAITVILAAVIAAFVLGLGDTNSTAPSVTFDYDYNQTNDNLTIAHQGGDSFDPARVDLQIEGIGAVASYSVDADADGATATSGAGQIFRTDMNTTSTVTAGDSITLDLDGDITSGVGSGSTTDFELDIIFTSEDGGTSSTIGGTTGPDA